MMNHVIWFHIGEHNIDCYWIQASRGKWSKTRTGMS